MPAFRRDGRGVIPEVLQLVELALSPLHYVNHHIAVIQQVPFVGAILFRTGGFLPLGAEGFFDFLGDGSDLRCAVARTDNEVISQTGNSARIQYQRVGGLFGFRQGCREGSQFKGARMAVAGMDIFLRLSQQGFSSHCLHSVFFGDLGDCPVRKMDPVYYTGFAFKDEHPHEADSQCRCARRWFADESADFFASEIPGCCL